MEKVIFEIERDPELVPLKQADLSQFNVILGIVKPPPIQQSLASPGGGCLAGETLVHTLEGTDKAISSIKTGDVVTVLNSCSEGAAVIRTFQVDENCIISINKGISCSLTQPFLTTQGLKKALELKRGDILVKSNRKVEPILDLQYKNRPARMYMIGLSDKHLFYAADYVVHNKLYDIS